jgi:hypothetical protein
VLLIKVPEGVQTPAAAGWHRQALAVADDSRAWVLSRNGLVSVPAAWAVAAWGVGHG